MISENDIKKLADLARIDVDEKEAKDLSDDMDAILDYVGQVSRFVPASPDEFDDNQIKNVMREDEVLNKPGSFSKEIIAEFPEKEGDYLKVKKIL